MFFLRTKRTPRPAQQRHDFPRVEYIPMSLTELQAFERVMVHGDACLRRGRPDLLSLHNRSTELIGNLYRSAGAASVHQADPARVRIPIQKGDLFWLEYRGCHREAVRAAIDADQVTLVDPVWGRDTLLWPALTEALAPTR
ncbi:DUF6919 domain-containing protein [Streptomyces olivaceus]|uniref:DUF6919 domain-containing protein n=1 Tax=Streptomyces olivaceus TaxID=47716 RepID=UPI0022EE7413|nr:hypothetical protein [Streptomyces olivaceus]GHI98133.1 hypothetical protein TPA0905_76040 [Streptomyces olivaceus]